MPDIRRGVEEVLLAREKYIAPQNLLKECTQERVGSAFKGLYQKILDPC
jgi:hypothetical protein